MKYNRLYVALSLDDDDDDEVTLRHSESAHTIFHLLISELKKKTSFVNGAIKKKFVKHFVEQQITIRLMHSCHSFCG